MPNFGLNVKRAKDPENRTFTMEEYENHLRSTFKPLGAAYPVDRLNRMKRQHLVRLGLLDKAQAEAEENEDEFTARGTRHDIRSGGVSQLSNF